jgi:FkbM family methyltransferase
MSNLLLTNPNAQQTETHAKWFCEQFIHSNNRPKFIFGRNVYVNKILVQVTVSGIIDDFTELTSYLGSPIVRLTQVPADALILIASGGRTLTAIDKLQSLGFECLDYFAFYKHSQLALADIVFNEGFQQEFEANQAQYEKLFNQLEDEESKLTFQKLISFRSSYDSYFLHGFSYREHLQYFEPFLALKTTGETFVDVGGYDGFTSAEFIKHCPNFKQIYIFEPEPQNLAACQKRFSHANNIYTLPYGLSNKSQTLKFSASGSGSQINENGSLEINVRPLDEINTESITLIKMDIEGAESEAIEGAKNTILRDHSRIALAAYHKPGDFWRLAEQVLTIRSDYRIYMRHYTESIYETVLFFIPS